jgi:hypothetical protein
MYSHQEPLDIVQMNRMLQNLIYTRMAPAPNGTLNKFELPNNCLYGFITNLWDDLGDFIFHRKLRLINLVKNEILERCPLEPVGDMPGFKALIPALDEIIKTNRLQHFLNKFISHAVELNQRLPDVVIPRKLTQAHNAVIRSNFNDVTAYISQFDPLIAEYEKFILNCRASLQPVSPKSLLAIFTHRLEEDLVQIKKHLTQFKQFSVVAQKYSALNHYCIEFNKNTIQKFLDNKTVLKSIYDAFLKTYTVDNEKQTDNFEFYYDAFVKTSQMPYCRDRTPDYFAFNHTLHCIALFPNQMLAVFGPKLELSIRSNISIAPVSSASASSRSQSQESPQNPSSSPISSLDIELDELSALSLSAFSQSPTPDDEEPSGLSQSEYLPSSRARAASHTDSNPYSQTENQVTRLPATLFTPQLRRTISAPESSHEVSGRTRNFDTLLMMINDQLYWQTKTTLSNKAPAAIIALRAKILSTQNQTELFQGMKKIVQAHLRSNTPTNFFGKVAEMIHVSALSPRDSITNALYKLFSDSKTFEQFISSPKLESILSDYHQFMSISHGKASGHQL